MHGRPVIKLPKLIARVSALVQTTSQFSSRLRFGFWRCAIGPDAYSGYRGHCQDRSTNVATLAELIASAPWREAVTYRETWPHEYVLTEKDNQKELLN